MINYKELTDKEFIGFILHKYGIEINAEDELFLYKKIFFFSLFELEDQVNKLKLFNKDNQDLSKFIKEVENNFKSFSVNYEKSALGDVDKIINRLQDDLKTISDKFAINIKNKKGDLSLNFENRSTAFWYGFGKYGLFGTILIILFFGSSYYIYTQTSIYKEIKKYKTSTDNIENYYPIIQNSKYVDEDKYGKYVILQLQTDDLQVIGRSYGKMDGENNKIKVYYKLKE